MLALPHRAVARIRFALFGLALGTLVACGGGHSGIAPSTAGPAVARGHMRITLTVAGKIDVPAYRYWIVFNTSGDGRTPEFGGKNTVLTAFSYALSLGENANAATPEAWEYLQSKNCPTCIPALLQLLTTPAQLQLGSTTSSFSLLVDRAIFNGVAPSGPMSNQWLFNAETVRAGGAVVDTMGACAGCFKSPSLAVNTPFDTTVQAEGDDASAPAAARIVSVTFDNAP